LLFSVLFDVDQLGVPNVHILKTILLSATILSPAVAYADEGKDIIIVTASGIEQPRSETGQAIDIIDRDRLDTLQTVTIADALRSLPSVSVAQRGSVGSQTSVFIRGGNSSQTLVLVDGVRVNDPSSPNGLYDFGALLSSNIGRVEVLRGPNSVIWGSQAIGGVINVATIKPTENLSGNVAAEYGYSDSVKLNANLSGTTGIFEGSVGGGYYRTDGISSLVGGTERDGYENYGTNGRLKINLSNNFALDFRGFYSDGTVEYDSPFGAGANALPVSRNKQFVGYTGANLTMFEGLLRHRIAYTRSDVKRIGSDPIIFSFNNFNVKGTVDRFEYHGAFDLVKAASTIVFGVEHERTFASTSFEGAPADIAKTSVSSAFLQLIFRPVTGLTLTGGVRHDDYNVYGGQTTLGGNIAYSPNGGATVLRATYGEGFRAPTLSEGQPPFGNPNLKPETARNFDLGVEHAFLDGSAQVYATYFNRKSTDLINFSPSFQLENIDRVRTTGLEMGMVLRPVSELDIRLGYSLVNAINQSASNFGKRLALRPKDNASLSIDWKSPWRVKLGTTIQLTGDSFDNASNSVRLDGYALVAVRAALPIDDRFEIYGRVDNVFDESYANVAGYSTYGRSAFAGVRARF
jgi:vitamin B12 transporter